MAGIQLKKRGLLFSRASKFPRLLLLSNFSLTNRDFFGGELHALCVVWRFLRAEEKNNAACTVQLARLFDGGKLIEPTASLISLCFGCFTDFRRFVDRTSFGGNMQGYD
jgi:hypothetical protein